LDLYRCNGSNTVSSFIGISIEVGDPVLTEL
jgi:hypothetical protein